MKKMMLLVLLSLSLSFYAQDKDLNVGINVGITNGDIKPYSNMAFGLDANYLFHWFEDFKFGPSVNLVYFSPKTVNGQEIKPLVYVPIGGSIRFQAFEEAFYAGGDVGYAIGLSPSGDRGGVYFKPIIGYNISNSLHVNVFYSTVKKRKPAYSYVGVGFSFNIFGESNVNAY